jgi:aminopeptidase N
MNKYDIKYLKLDLSVEPASKFIAGSCMYRVITKQALDTFAIEFKQAMTLDSVHINNTKETLPAVPIISILLFRLPVASQVEVKFFTVAHLKMVFTQVLMQVLDYLIVVLCLKSFQAREWFPAKQLLNDKIDSADIWFTTTAPNIAASNGLLKSVVDLPNNKKQYQWHTNYPMNYYMPFYGVGNYMEYRNYAKPVSINPDSVLIQHLLVNNQAYFNSQKVNLDKTPPYLEKMSELFGIYPFYKEKYGHAQVGLVVGWNTRP